MRFLPALALIALAAPACKTPTIDQSHVAEADSAQPVYQTFCDWYHDRANLSSGAQIIIDQIMAQVSNCDEADSHGTSTTNLDLSSLEPGSWDLRPLSTLSFALLNITADKIGDLSPLKVTGLAELGLYGKTLPTPPTGLEQLASFPSLKTLYLSSYNFGGNTAWLSEMTNLNELSISAGDFGDNDLKKLIPLNRKLTTLTLQYLPITDLAPLGLLVNITSLTLSHDNALQNISDLGYLINLTTLEVVQCKVTDVSSLANLTFLDMLLLYGNQITDVTPLANLSGLRELFLGNNQIADFSPLLTLTHLQMLDLSSNPGTPGHCPVLGLNVPTTQC